MRKIANVNVLKSNAVRLMIFDKGKDGVFVFGYQSEKDSSCSWDCHYNHIEDAYEMGNEYGIQKEDWKVIPDSPDHCQDDWIDPAYL